MRITRLASNAFLVLGLIGGSILLPATLLGILLHRWTYAEAWDRNDRRQALAAFTLLDLVIFAVLWMGWHLPGIAFWQVMQALSLHTWRNGLASLVLFWVTTIPAAPLIALLIQAVTLLWQVSLAMVFSDQTTQKRSLIAPAVPELGEDQGEVPPDSTQQVCLEPAIAILPSLVQQAQTLTYYYDTSCVASRVPFQVNGLAVIGQPQGGDLDWVQGGWFIFPEEAMREHGIISGGSGSGKTSFALRLASIARSVYGWRVYYLDAKADEETATSFVAEMQRLGTSVRVFPQEPMDGWRGTSAVLRNRLLQLLTYSESFYKDGARLLLGLALDAPGGIARSSMAFLQRLDKKRLEQLYRTSPKRELLQHIKSAHFDGTRLRYESFFTSVQTLLDGSWSWEDTPAAYIALDSLGQQDDTQALGRFLIEDFGHFMKHRKPPQERVLLILEEFSALAEQVEVTNLFQRIRSAGGSVFVITQGDKSLGTQTAKLIQACANLVVFQGSDPDVLIHQAGTRMVPEHSLHRSTPETQPSRDIAPAHSSTEQRSMTLRMQERPKIHANQVQQLHKGEGFFIFKGQTQKVQVEPLVHSPDMLQAIRAQLRLSDQHQNSAVVEAQGQPAQPALPTKIDRISSTEPAGLREEAPPVPSSGKLLSQSKPETETATPPIKKQGRSLFDA